MIRNGITYITLASLVAIVCLFAVAAPVSAGIDVTIDPVTIDPDPCISLPGASPGYTCVLDYSDTCDIYFVNVIIPKGYTAVDLDGCACSGIILTLRNETGDIISKSVAFKGAGSYWVNVTHTAYDDLYGPFGANCSAGGLTELCMGHTARLRLTMPTEFVNGSIEISLGALGPLTPGDSMTLEFVSDCIKNPETSGRYTWLVTTGDPCSHADSCVVCIMHPGDITGDDEVNLWDLVDLADAYLSHPGDTKWNQCADLNCDRTVDIHDLVILADNYLEEYNG